MQSKTAHQLRAQQHIAVGIPAASQHFLKAVAGMEVSTQLAVAMAKDSTYIVRWSPCEFCAHNLPSLDTIDSSGLSPFPSLEDAGGVPHLLDLEAQSTAIHHCAVKTE